MVGRAFIGVCRGMVLEWVSFSSERLCFGRCWFVAFALVFIFASFRFFLGSSLVCFHFSYFWCLILR